MLDLDLLRSLQPGEPVLFRFGPEAPWELVVVKAMGVDEDSGASWTEFEFLNISEFTLRVRWCQDVLRWEVAREDSSRNVA